MAQDILLYDLPSKGQSGSWSANSLKTRIALNYKSIPYRTEWVPFSIQQDTLRSKGITPNPPGSFVEFSIPVIKLPDGSHVMDSAKIAPVLEDLQPSPSLRLETGLHERALAVLGSAVGPLVPYFMPRVNRDIVIEDDYEWFHQDRTRRFGTDLFEMEKQKAGGAFEAAKPAFDELVKFLRENKKDEGPFILGSEPSYGDIVIVAAIHMFKRLGDDPFENFMGGRMELVELYEASKPWLQKMD